MITWLPDMEVFRNLPLSVISVIFLYFLMFSIFWLWTYRTNQAHQKKEQEKDEKYKAELLIAAKKAEAANEAKETDRIQSKDQRGIQSAAGTGK